MINWLIAPYRVSIAMNIRKSLYSLLLTTLLLAVMLLAVLEYFHRYQQILSTIPEQTQQLKQQLSQLLNSTSADQPPPGLSSWRSTLTEVRQQLSALPHWLPDLENPSAELQARLQSYQQNWLSLIQIQQQRSQQRQILQNRLQTRADGAKPPWQSLLTLEQMPTAEQERQLASLALLATDAESRQWLEAGRQQQQLYRQQLQLQQQLQQTSRQLYQQFESVQNAVPRSQAQHQNRLFGYKLLAIIAILLGGISLMWLIIRSVSRRLERLTAQIRHLAVANFDLQLAAEGQDEFERLGNSFFELSAKLRGSFEQLQWQQKELAHRHQQLQSSLTQLEATRLDLIHSESKYSQLFIASGDSILLLDDDFIMDANPAAAELFALAEPSLLILQPFSQFSSALQTHGEDAAALFEQYRLQAQQQGLARFEWLCRRPNAELFVAEMALVPCFIGHKQVVQATLRDISERKKNEQAILQANTELRQKFLERTQNLQQLSNKLQREKFDRRRVEATLEQIAHFDELTGLANRSLLKDRLEQALLRFEPHPQPLALLLLDLDRFKHINDSLGHDAGDLLLIEAARRLKSLLSPQQTGARLGGDEFAVLVLDGAESEELAHLASRILSHLSRPFVIDGHEVFASASIGIACYPGDADSADTLLQSAEMAMYHAKQQGRHNYQFYRAELNLLAQEYLNMEQRLRKALRATQFELFYQPQVKGSTGQIAGFESLIRWRDTDGQLVETMKFVSFAEHLGLMIPMGNWVIREACQQIRRWQDQGLGLWPVAVNFSARQFRFRNLVAVVEASVNEAGIPPSMLGIELTESTLMEDRQEVTALLNQFRHKGFRIAIDDFGTGYSSLAYLKHFPIDCLKIDRSFVRDLPQDSEDSAIVRTIIALAKNLNFKLVAEGVETLAQCQFLTEQGCDLMQGYLYSKPVTAQQVPELLAQASEGKFNLLTSNPGI